MSIELDHRLAGHGEPLLLIHGIGSTGRIWKPGLGHAPMADDPEVVADAILQFTARHARAGSLA